MVSVNYDGRLGNNLIQYSVANFFAKKHNFNFVPPSHTINSLLTNTQNEGFIGGTPYIINDNNFLDEMEKTHVDKNHYIFSGFFQQKSFFEKLEKIIKSYFKLNYNQVDDESVFIHYRIGDIINDRRMLPIEYYEEALDKLGIKKGYISSDTINHKFCNHLIQKYNLKPIIMTPIEVINFGKNFNNIILSEGTFSWWIGFLSNAKNVICNQRNYFWHGDIFFDRWTKLSWDYELTSIYDRYKLKEYKPTNLNYVNN